MVCNLKINSAGTKSGESNVECNVPRHVQVSGLFALRERLVRAARMEIVFMTLLL
jgi:hypothetical protein